ncbi:MAG: hypothetical protein GY792_00210 [Gammaproteobacteria bacterium]|nr:hypothetical protein [Gammaproteobacteria bacterium]
MAHIANCVRCALVTGHWPEIVPNGCFLISYLAALDTLQTVGRVMESARNRTWNGRSDREDPPIAH